MYTARELELLAEAASLLRDGLPLWDRPERDPDALRAVLLEVAGRLRDNYPYHHPLYAGQMLRPPHAVARLAYALALTVNPNNHALDGGRASSAMELEAVAAIAAMFGWRDHLGHLTGGGTVANMEALWVARELHPERPVAASTGAHYTHTRLASVLGIPFVEVPMDRYGRMDLDALEDLAKTTRPGTVVATLGTTGTGSVDPLEEILALGRRYGFRVHADAAYGGYFVLADNLAAEARRAFDALGRVDSIVIDPHKHGLQPYGCGCVLFRDRAVARIYHHESAYTYFTAAELHLGEISLECSRAGAAAVALWATQRLLPPVVGGEFAAGLAACRRAALGLHEALGREDGVLTLMAPDLDIVCWAPAGPSASAISRSTRAAFDAAAERGLHLAIMELPAALASAWWRDTVFDRETVSVLRSCLMKPEHEQWLPAILERLRAPA